MLRACAIFAGSLAQLVLAGPRVAMAQEPPPLVVFYAPPGGSAAVSRARTALNQAARQAGTVVVDLSPIAEPPPEAPQELRRGIESYHNFQYDQAHDHLQRAAAEAQKTGAQGLSASELTDIYIYSALVAAQRGDQALAWDQFVDAATMDPTRRLDPVRFPPRVIESYQRAVATVSAAERAEVTFEVDDRCQVLLDAAPVAPRAVVRVAPGHHYVRVTCPGYSPHGARVAISESAVTMAPPLVAPAQPDEAQVLALAGERGARTVIMALLSMTGSAEPTLLLRLFAVDTGKERSRAFAGVKNTRAAADNIRVAVQRLVNEVVAPPLPVVVVQETPWYGRPWVWGVTGAAVTAAVLLPFVLTSDPSPGFTVRPGGQFPP